MRDSGLMQTGPRRNALRPAIPRRVLPRRIVVGSLSAILSLLVTACWLPSVFAQEEAPREEAPRGTTSAVLPALADQAASLNATGAQDAPAFNGLTELASSSPQGWTTPEGLQSTLQVVAALTVISMAPAILLMTTSFVRIVVVLGLLRQALGIQQMPPNQVMTSIALFMTLLIMTPVWTEVYENSIRPYTDPDTEMSLEQAWQAGVAPVRRFMSRQIEIAGNGDDIWLFFDYLPADRPEIRTYDDVPLHVLLPAFMLSELKTSFLIGFQIYLPFLILDLVVASVTISMGMVMLPPTMVSLPLKLMLFVMVDGWRLVVGMLLQSFSPY